MEHDERLNEGDRKLGISHALHAIMDRGRAEMQGTAQARGSRQLCLPHNQEFLGQVYEGTEHICDRLSERFDAILEEKA